MGEGARKPLRLTRHAQTKIVERRIDEGWVDRVARQPDWVEPEPRHHGAERPFGAINEFGGRILRVVCVEKEREIRIITVTFDRNARRSR